MIRYNLMYHIRPFGGTICSYHVRPFSGNPKLLIFRKLSLFDILKITFFVSLFPTRLLSLLCNWKEFILLYSGVFVYCSQEKYSRVCIYPESIRKFTEPNIQRCLNYQFLQHCSPGCRTPLNLKFLGVFLSFFFTLLMIFKPILIFCSNDCKNKFQVE